MDILSLDFETRSECPINHEGAYIYATHLSTTVYMLGWAFNDEPVQVWVAEREPFPQRIIDHIKAGGIITAWNATFERLIFEYVLCNDFPEVPVPRLEQYRCTAVRARAHGLPGKLDHAGKCLGYPIEKLGGGTRLIRIYCANNVPWDDIPEEDQIEMIEYCRVDVEVERGVGTCLRELTDYEWAEYHANERTNDRGIPVDLEFAAAATEYAEDIRADVDAKLAALTGGVIKKSTQRKARDAWVLPQLSEEQLKLVTTKKDAITFDQAHRDELALHPSLPEPVGRYLDLMNEAGGATISKYVSMTARSIDGRLPGSLIFNGAGQTGRYSAMGFQAHNMKRSGSVADPDAMIARIIEGLFEVPDAAETLGALVRFAVQAKAGKKLSWADWSSIEGRVAPWLAASVTGKKKLQMYRDGVDPYKVNAAKTYGVHYDDVTKDQRQAGKVQELALGFLGGVGALRQMARGFGLHIPEDEAEQMRDAWRDVNPWAIDYGNRLERAAFMAYRKPGKWVPCGRVSYAYDGETWLWCKLPSGRMLAYYNPRAEWQETPWGEEVLALTCVWGAAKPKVGAPKWPRRAMHRGLWLENITQATAADLLRECLVRLDKLNVPVVMHVHDEIIAEGDYQAVIEREMSRVPAWADGLPLAVEGDSGVRYGK